MRTKCVGFLAAIAMAVLAPGMGLSQVQVGVPRVFTLVELIEFARSGAPDVQLAIAEIAEGEGRLVRARSYAAENPEVAATFGPSPGGGNLPDASLGVEIPIELGGRRQKRISLAEESVRRDRRMVEETRRQAVEPALLAFFRVLEVEEQLRLARERKALAEELLGVARDRYSLGDIPLFEVNLAQSEDARAMNDIALWEGRVDHAKKRMVLVLGLPVDSEVLLEGNLRDRRLFDSIRGEATAMSRSDILLAQAEVETAEAEVALAGAERTPDLSFLLDLGREDEAGVVRAGVSVKIPLFNPRKGELVEAQARRQRAETALEIKRNRIGAEIETARIAYRNALDAVQRMESDILPRIQVNEELARDSFKAGKIPLGDLILQRRESLETRREHIERLLEAAEAGVAMIAATGAYPTTEKP
jgi:cobalt-zinc-cadmium efflux system outer membrane protein